MPPVRLVNERKVMRVDIKEGAQQRARRGIVHKGRSKTHRDVVGAERRDQRVVHLTASCQFRRTRLVFRDAIEAFPRAQGQAATLDPRFDVMEATVEGFIARPITDQVIAALIVHHSPQPKIVRVAS